MARIKSYYMNSCVTNKYIDNKVFGFQNTVETKPKDYHSTEQGPASALWRKVLSCCSWGGHPCLLPILGLAVGPHPFAAAVIILWYLCTQLIPQAKYKQLKLSKTDPLTWS
jgi:hypothetical protein